MANTITGGTAATAALGSILVSDLITEVREALRDTNTLAYKPAQTIPAYNRAIEEIRDVLVLLGADLVTGELSLIGDGTAQDFALPPDFMAFTLEGVRPRSPAAALADFSHGAALVHADHLGAGVTAPVTVVSPPARYVLVGLAGIQYLRFNTIPPTGNYFDARYYQAPTRVTLATYAATYTPWLGLCDPLIKRTLELFLREGLEFTVDAREAWRLQAAASLQGLLGLRHLQTRVINPSSWRGLP